jgi:hypothetical protein
MCGELEDDGNHVEEQLYARFRLRAGDLMRAHAADPAAKDVNAYMDRLFADALSRCARDGDGEDGGYERLRLQPLVFARLAGFLAAHMSLQEDPLRKTMEALLHGYAEAEHMTRDHHGHDHGHGGHHHHDHHH